jgi:hypothetical protein
MTVLMFATWVVLIIFTVMAFWKGKIFLAKPEDVLKDSGDVQPQQLNPNAANFSPQFIGGPMTPRAPDPEKSTFDHEEIDLKVGRH